MATAVEQIAVKQKQYNDLAAKLPALVLSEQQWRTQSNEPCNQMLKAKKAECIADKEYKKAQADGKLALINSTKQQMVLIEQEIDTLKQYSKDEGQAMINLANQGTSMQAEAIKAEGQAAAAAQVAAAQAAAVEKQSQAAVDQSKMTNYLIYGGVGLAVIVIVVVVIFKMKKKKN